jgi:hypothetical protein
MWKYIGVSIAGTSHLNKGEPCQDFNAFCSDGKSFFASIADGAGSALKSQQGSAMACEVALIELSKLVALGNMSLEESLKASALKARNSIFQLADKEGIDSREYACTLLVFATTSSGSAALQIGDGIIVYRCANHDWSVATWPQRGEYSNTTFFITDKTFEENVEIVRLPERVIEAALVSDGLEPIAVNYAEKRAHTPFWNGIFKPVRQSKKMGLIYELEEPLESFLSSDKVKSRVNDDLSIVLASRIDESNSGEKDLPS